MAAQRLARAASRLMRMIGEDDCALAGGLAVSAHGYVRATRDVDIIVAVPLEEARRRLSAHGLEMRLLRGDIFEGDFPCLKGVIDGVPFDVLPPLVPIEPDRTVLLDLHPLRLRVVDFDTLTRLKLKAGSPKDLWDIAILANLRPDRRERALRLAAHDPALVERLISFIDDPRARREASERAAEPRRITRKNGRRRSKRAKRPRKRA
ncbi:MAG: hypothetical protein ACRD1X_19550 [Vicinamibacteria bacterium]